MKLWKISGHETLRVNRECLNVFPVCPERKSSKDSWTMDYSWRKRPPSLATSICGQNQRKGRRTRPSSGDAASAVET